MSSWPALQELRAEGAAFLQHVGSALHAEKQDGARGSAGLGAVLLAPLEDVMVGDLEDVRFSRLDHGWLAGRNAANPQIFCEAISRSTRFMWWCFVAADEVEQGKEVAIEAEPVQSDGKEEQLMAAKLPAAAESKESSLRSRRQKQGMLTVNVDDAPDRARAVIFSPGPAMVRMRSDNTFADANIGTDAFEVRSWRSSSTIRMDSEEPRRKTSRGSPTSPTTPTTPTSPTSLGMSSPTSSWRISHASTREDLERLKVPVSERSKDSVAVNLGIGAKDDYTMEEELGVGGFGSVYKATSKKDSKTVAVKIIPRGRLHSEETFQDELRVARRLTHPNIVKLYASYEDDENYYLVMEFCKGGTLAKYVSGKTVSKDDLGIWSVGLDAELIAKYAWQMLSGIAYLHCMSVVHRDIKLENYMRVKESDGANLKLIDMGLATRIKKNRRLHERVGTLMFMAPEVRKKDYDEKVDIWGIGMVLYMCAVCMDPWFTGNDHRAMNEEEILDSLEDPKLQIKYYDWRWQLKEHEVRALVECLLVVDPQTRPGAREVLQKNAWLKTVGRDGDACCCTVS
ncbi:unnamed protein product [Effrenium voratum]|uniref:non-specific serine/threonine protein kinase n=1 Tax=Effrenium voratum TaxID=2562239 RepID=A0AA36JJS0_9DINO|nr:unnamed protein product [Effrenium voratum]